jgi:hypothetical protein
VEEKQRALRLVLRRRRDALIACEVREEADNIGGQDPTDGGRRESG